jgi:hypothetical protein
VEHRAAALLVTVLALAACGDGDRLTHDQYERRLDHSLTRLNARILALGAACTANRELLDLFDVAEDPATGKAAVVYSDTTRATWTGADGVVHQLPEIVLAYEK